MGALDTFRDIAKRFGPARGVPQSISALGDTTVYTPASSYRVRLKWLGLSSPSTNTAGVLVTVKWSDGTLIYLWDMGVPGAFSHSSVREGPVDASLIVNLSDSQVVRVNLDAEDY